MASALRHLKTMELHHGVAGVAGLALDGAVAFGTGVAVGEVYHRYGDRWYGKHAPKLVGALGKAVAIGLAVAGHGGLISGVFNAAGDAGVAIAGLDVGLRHARKSSGKRAVLIPEKAALPAGGSETSLGGRPAGKGMSWAAIQDMASAR